jgi:hypothetical protein
MCHLIKNVLPADYHTNLNSITLDNKVLTDILKVHNPELSKKLDQLNIDLTFITTKWFVSCFTLGP